MYTVREYLKEHNMIKLYEYIPSIVHCINGTIFMSKYQKQFLKKYAKILNGNFTQPFIQTPIMYYLNFKYLIFYLTIHKSHLVMYELELE